MEVVCRESVAGRCGGPVGRECGYAVLVVIVDVDAG